MRCVAPPRHHGMTLIEILAVVCITALVGSMTIAGLGGADAASRQRTLVSDCRRLEARARLLARMEGPVAVTASEDGRALTAGRLGDDIEAEPTLVLSVEVPPPWRVRLMGAEMVALHGVRIDAQGRSDDYGIELRRGGEADGALRQLSVAGLTGWIEEMVVEP
jgi:type II secretory pathway pseudopilin PulG